MAISAALVKELRQRTGAGMMECKKALVATDGDIDAAADNMRREGLAKADKKAGRVAAEGRIATAVSSDQTVAVLAEVNCETDFVAQNEDFIGFADNLARAALDQSPADLNGLIALEIDGESIDARRRALYELARNERSDAQRDTHIRRAVEVAPATKVEKGGGGGQRHVSASR